MKDAMIKGLKTWRRSSWMITLPVVLLLIIGVLFVYSSCYVSDDQTVRPLYERQVVWLVAGLVCYVGFALYDFRRFKRNSWWIYGASLVLLVLVLFIGRTIYGAKRWLMLFGENGIGVQPSEIAKLATVIVLAHRLSESGRDLLRPREFLAVLGLVVLPVALIMKQPDLGTAMVFVPTAFSMMFVAGIPFRYLASLAGVGFAAVVLLLSALFLPAHFGVSETTQTHIREWTGLSEYQRGRIEVFLHPDTDPLGAGWNKRQSEIAVGSGGLWGKGYLRGTQNILGFLPRSVAPTDFIYSVIAEEKGFVGSVAVLFLFGVVLIFGMMAALRTRDPMGRLLCAGVVSLIFCHVFINIAMTVGVMPITGLPLPFLSYGGSFMIIMMSALGIVQSVYIRSQRRDMFR